MNANVEKPNGRGWVRLKLTFTDRVMDDKGVPPIPFKLAAALARYADAETGIVDKSQAFLADVVNVKLRALQLAIDLLAKRGHVVVLTPKGRKLGNRYRPVLRPKDDPDPVHVHDGAHEGDPVHMHDGAHEADFHAHETAISYAPGCAPLTPVLSPVIHHPSSGATIDRSSEARTTTTIGIAEDKLLDEIRTAIETAGGRLAKRRHNLQPIRDLIATGIPRDLAVAVVAERAARLGKAGGPVEPLGNLDASWLLDCIRDRAVADGSTSTTAKPADTGPTVAIPGHATTRWPVDGVTAWAARWWNRRSDDSWSNGLGETPDQPDPRRSAEFQAALDAGRAEIEAAARAWPANRAIWDVKRFGPPPDSLGSRLGPDFGIKQVALRHGHGSVTEFALLHVLRRLAVQSPKDFEREFVNMFRALPSPFDAEDCVLTLYWQIKALEYRNAKL